MVTIATLAEYAAGNPGAMNFLVEVKRSEPAIQTVIFATLHNARSIRGTNLYVLYSDLCGKDIGKVAALCVTCPMTILEDACSRQDRSGQELVKPYLDPLNAGKMDDVIKVTFVIMQNGKPVSKLVHIRRDRFLECNEIPHEQPRDLYKTIVDRKAYERIEDNNPVNN